MKSALLALAALILAGTAATAQWTPVPTPGPLDGIELCLASPDRLFAGTTAGRVFASSDHGSVWSAVGGGQEPNNAPIVSLVRAGDWVVAARSGVGPVNVRTRFDAVGWTPGEPLPYQEGLIRSTAVIGETLFAVIGGALYRSDDHGAGWGPLAGLGEHVQGVYAHGSTLLASPNVINGGQFHAPSISARAGPPSRRGRHRPASARTLPGRGASW